MPLVTVAIPTYNRPESLERAIGSALTQTHDDLEVLVSDDASTDPRVTEVLQRLSAADPRVRVERQPINVGHAGNYQWLLDAARGEYFMWLADDDWLDPEYVSGCLAVLRRDRRAILVCGLGRYYREGRYVLKERPIDLDSPRPAARLIDYFRRVSLNGPLFGLVRRSDLLPTGFPQVVGGDWLLVAALAAHGQVRTLCEVHIHRSLSGLGADPEELAGSFGMSGWAQRQHHAVAAYRIGREIGFRSEAFAGMGPLTRAGTGVAAALLILVRFTAADAARRALGPRARTLEAWISRRLRGRDSRRVSPDRHH